MSNAMCVHGATCVVRQVYKEMLDDDSRLGIPRTFSKALVERVLGDSDLARALPPEGKSALTKLKANEIRREEQKVERKQQLTRLGYIQTLSQAVTIVAILALVGAEVYSVVTGTDIAINTVATGVIAAASGWGQRYVSGWDKGLTETEIRTKEDGRVLKRAVLLRIVDTYLPKDYWKPQKVATD